MAVQSDTSRIQYAGNNSTVTSYAVPFVFLENSHLQAIARTSAGVESAVTLTNHTGAGDVNGGTVRTAVAVPATSTLTIFREVPITQTTQYQEGGDFPAASHERALDKLTQVAQQLDRGLERTIRFSESSPSNQLPAPPSGKQIIVASNGVLDWEPERQVPAYPTSGGTKLLTSAGGGAVPTWQDAPSIAVGAVAATGSTTPRFLADRFADIVNVKDFGAEGDGLTSDSAAIQAAFNACPIGGCLYFPPTANGYRITTTVNLWQDSGVANRKKNITLFGHNTRLRLVHDNPTTTPPTVMFRVRNTPDMKFEGLHFDGGQPFVPFAQGTSFSSGNFAYLGLLSFEYQAGYLTGERCDNCSVINCTFTDARCFGIMNLNHGGVDVPESSGSFNEVFSVQNCVFDSLDSAIITNPAAPRRIIIQGNRITNGQTRQFLDPSIWGGDRNQNHTSFFATEINGVAIVLMANQNADSTNNILHFHRATSQQWIIANNMIDNWGHMGIETWGGNNITFSGNSISRVVYGISLAHTTAQNVACVGNVFRGNLNYDLEWGASSSTVIGNTFDGRAIIDNSAERSLCDYGIIAWHGAIQKEPTLISPNGVGNTFSGNVFVGHRRFNISLRGGENTTICGNNFSAGRASSHIGAELGIQNLIIDGNNFVTRQTEPEYGVLSRTNSAIFVTGGSPPRLISSITRSDATATATTSGVHGYTAGDLVVVYGANESEYNGTFTVSATGLTTTQFQFAVSGSPASPATGTIRTIFVELPHIDVASLAESGGVATAECNLPASSLTRSGAVATFTSATAHNLVAGQAFIVQGADQSQYNATGVVLATGLTATSFEYSVTGSPTTPATGASIRLFRPHGLVEGQTINIWGADQTEYNGLVTVDQVVNSTSFRYAVSGSPTTPSTGTIKIGRMRKLNTNGVTISNNTIDGHYNTHALLFTNDAQLTVNAQQSLTNVKVVGNHATPDALAGASMTIANNGGRSFRSFYAANNTGGLRDINNSWLRYNQVDVPSISNAAPAWRPRWIGDMYYNAATATLYVATGTASASDWIAQTTNRVGTTTYDPPNLIDGSGATTTVAVSGAALGDYAEASFSLDLQGITVTAWVSAVNTVSVRFQNETGGTLDLGSGTLRARVFKP